MARVEDDDLAGESRSGAADGLGLAQRVGPPPTTVRASRSSAANVTGPQVPSASIPMLRWNSRSACSVSAPEHAVDPTAVEAHVEQPLLQRRDVVAGQQPAAGSRTGSGRPAASGPPPARGTSPADDAVDRDAALLLELADRSVARLVEQRVLDRPAGSAGGSVSRPSSASFARISATAGPWSPRR